ncbi:MAG: DUF1674 domain-containing protein [Pseudomonadota bacterium]
MAKTPTDEATADQDAPQSEAARGSGVGRALAPAAQRALAEAAERRAAARASEPPPAAEAPEIGGRDGPDPTRYGDWEKKGIISDF